MTDPQEEPARQPDELSWFVAHTRPRCEKKLAEYCLRAGLLVTLPLYKSIKRYPGKVAVFEKPLFPNYLFLRLRHEERRKVYQSDYVANLLEVPDEQTFEEQLRAILDALETEYEICLLPHITVGKRVKIKSGPLRGMEGYVDDRQGKAVVVLRLDFIAKAAGVKVDAADLELID